MRLYQQLVLFMLAATVLPLALVGFWLLRTAEDELFRRIGQEQEALGVVAARDASQAIMTAVEALGRGTEAIDWAEASREEREGGLALLYQQAEAAAAVVLVDAAGNVLAGPVRRTGEDGHPAFDPAHIATLISAIPLQPLTGGNKGQAALSSAWADPLGGASRMAVAVKAAPGTDAPFVLAELGLEELERGLMERARSSGARFDLVDGGGRVIASSDPRRRMGPLEGDVWARARASTTGQERFTTSGEVPLLVSAVKVPGELGLWAVVSETEADALAPVARMRRTVLISIGVALVVLLALGAAYTRRLNRRIGELAAGAEAFGRGELSRRVAMSGADELADLATTFNQMGAELEAARAKLLRWNDELQQKVDEALADLRAAQAQLLEAQKLAAVGQLGAGVAHEINNPLAGILGNTQLLMMDRDESDPDFETLRKIEISAKRCKEITANLLRFSQQRDRPELRPVNLNGVVREAISLQENQIKGEGIQVSVALCDERLQVNADPGHVQQVVLAVMANARTAMMKTPTKRLTLRTRGDGVDAVIEIEDTGKGIAPEHLPRIFEPFFTTKDVWSNVGLGLSVAYRVMSEHRGRIDVRSEPGKGTLVTLRLPLLEAKGDPARSAA
ncbi:MAG: HAMP domain-containing protein [Myxococcaceae bacterium]|nr:HAMP domain-containing protein [Myxococcaceae bacterium]